MYFDGEKMPKFDTILPISDGKVHEVILKFPQDFKDTCEDMFSGITSITEIKFINFSGCTKTKQMLQYMNSLTLLDLSQFNTELVTNMELMFHG